MDKEREEEIKRIWADATKDAKIIKSSDRWDDPKDHKAQLARIDRYFDLIEERMNRPENRRYYFGEK